MNKERKFELLTEADELLSTLNEIYIDLIDIYHSESDKEKALYFMDKFDKVTMERQDIQKEMRAQVVLKNRFNMNKFRELVELSNVEERFRIAVMLNNAADYVRSVVYMEEVAARAYNLNSEDIEKACKLAVRIESRDLNAFISNVDAVNNICDNHSITHIYTGGSERNGYGDFAMQLVTVIFRNHH